MKKFSYYLLSLIILLGYSTIGFAQGNTCTNPEVVSSLPFEHLALSSSVYGNDYSASSSCSGSNTATILSKSYDYVLKYTPSSTENIQLHLSNISFDATFTLCGVAVYVMDGCIDNAASNCIFMEEMLSNPGNYSSADISLQGGTEYTFLIALGAVYFATPNTIINANFDISITTSGDQPAQIDGGIASISHNPSSCNLGVGEPIVIEIKNFGLDTIQNFQVGYRINQGSDIIETFTGSILPGATALYGFSQSPDLSQSSFSYIVETFTLIPNDTVYTMNDTMSTVITHPATFNTYPYFEDFETGAGSWFAEGESSSWEYAVPTASLIGSAYSGSNCWVTNADGDYNFGEISYLISPCFDFTGLSNPMIDMMIRYEMDCGTCDVQYSTDFGANWSRIGDATSVGPNWYNNSDAIAWLGKAGGWKHAFHSVAELAGQSNVMFRFRFQTEDLGIFCVTNEGFAVDNFVIKETPPVDLEVLGISQPISGCGLDQQNITIAFRNNSAEDTLSNFQVSYSINGGSFVSDSVFTSLNPATSSSTTFSQTEDFSSVGKYQIVIAVNHPADENQDNDTLITQIIHYASMSDTSYLFDFEPDSELWFSSGTNSSWQEGIPGATIINSASSGNNAWGTNLTGNHNISEVSYITSPCLDLSSFSIPYILSDIWYETSPDSISQSAVICLQYSTDGQTWTTIGANDEGMNWYNAPAIYTGWIGSSSGWKTAGHEIYSLAGNTSVQFRFKFLTLGGNSEGFSFDRFRIVECNQNTANFTYSANLLEVSFTDQSSNTETYEWSFGDGQSSTEASPIHNYSTEGSYNVTQICSNSCSTDTVVMTIDVYNCVSTVADFTWSSMNLEASFTNTSVNADSYVWDFGDGSTAAEASPLHTYSIDGTYTVSLISTNSCNTDTLTQQVSVADCIHPVSDFNYSVSDHGMKISFTSTSTSATSWQWDFGDSQTAVSEIAEHTYSQEGQYIVSLIATNSCSSDTLIDTIGVSCEQVSAQINYSFVNNGMGVSFENTTLAADSYTWDFGDGAGSVIQNPTHNYQNDGTYNITFIGTNNCHADTITMSIIIAGIDELDSESINIHPNPASNFVIVEMSRSSNSLNYQLFSSEGKLVLENNSPVIGANSFEIGTQELSKGIYLIKIQDGDNYLTRRIVIE